MKHAHPASPAHPFPDGVSPADITDARNILHNLGTLAHVAMGVSRDPREGCQSLDELEHRIQLLRHLVDRMGWVADVALRRLGDRGMLARPEDWMLPEV